MKTLITGSSKGIGLEITECLLSKNQFVVGLSRENNLENKNFIHYQYDFSKNKSIDKIKEISKCHNDINTIIINAGYGVFKELEQFSDQEIVDLFNVNFVQQVILLKHLLPSLKKQKNAKIILIGSEAGLSGAKKSTIYSASKFALNGFAQSLRKECKNINVTIINTGMVNSNFYDNLSFTHGSDEHNYIKKLDIVRIVDLILALGDNLNLDEINLSPMKKVIKK